MYQPRTNKQGPVKISQRLNIHRRINQDFKYLIVSIRSILPPQFTINTNLFGALLNSGSTHMRGRTLTVANIVR